MDKFQFGLTRVFLGEFELGTIFGDISKFSYTVNSNSHAVARIHANQNYGGDFEKVKNFFIMSFPPEIRETVKPHLKFIKASNG